MAARRYWADIARTAKSDKRHSKPNIVFDGEKIVKVRRLMDLPVAEGDEVFIDVMFPEVLADLAELLRKCVRVYLLKKTKLIKGFRISSG